tara:strand:+ start:869 stop:1534 length:666 start_codon:yes stop_codon:yes gene_type:complete
MIILITLWFILQWQFPTWLWVFSILLYATSLRPSKKKVKTVRAQANVLPFYLALAIIFGSDINGFAILPVDISAWTVVGIMIGSFLLRVIIMRPDKIIKKEMSKAKEKDKKVDFTIDGSGVVIKDDDDDGLTLHIKIKNKEKNKSSNFKVGLENGFIGEFFIKKIVLKGMKNAWKDSQFIDESGKPLFDIDEIYSKAKENPIKGEVLSIDNEKVTIDISIK